MVATRADITLNAGWTGAQLMTALEQAHVAAGLAVGACRDRWDSGAWSHLVHRVQMNSNAYGSDYVWWTYNSGTFYLQRAVGGWDSTTHQPLGTQYLDYAGADLTSNAWMTPFGYLSAASSLIVRRYTSGLDSKFTAFVLKQGGTQICWFYTSTNATPQSWIDFSKSSMINVYVPNFYTNGFYAYAGFCNNNALRRDLHVGTALKGLTYYYYYRYFYSTFYKYAIWGAGNSTTNNWYLEQVDGFGNAPGVNPYMNNAVIPLPGSDSTNNPSFAARHFPVYSGLAYNPYVLQGMPDDFGLVSTETNAMQNGDALISNPGVEEWEVVTNRNHNGSTNYSNVAFCARMV